MPLTKEFAHKFADEWLSAWNGKNIEQILDHYDDEVVFSSPFILRAQLNSSGTINGKAALKNYFEQALEKNPDLHFDLKHVLVGTKSITLIYLRKGIMLSAETMILNEKGKVVEGLSHYAADPLN